MKTFLLIIILISLFSLNLSAISYSLEFDGINDYVDCGNDPSLTEFNELTFEAWVWLEDSYPNQKVVNKLQDWYTNYYIFGVGTGALYCELVANGNMISFASGEVPSQEWTHIALTFRKGEGGNNGTCYGYINGEIVYTNESVPDAAISAGNPAYPFRIGCACWDINYFHVDGFIDEVRMWNIQRTTVEIRNFKDTILTGNEPGLVAYYPMTAGSGTTITDHSYYSNTGTLFDGGIVGHGPEWTSDGFRAPGDGSAGDPFQISELRHLSWICFTHTAWGSYFEQTADINAAVTSTWDTGSGFTKITYFNGNYYGNDHVIDSLFINRPYDTYIGFIGNMDGTVSNLGLTNLDVTGSGEVGGLAGVHQGHIESCYVTGSVTGDNHVGGLAGYVVGSTDTCYVSGDIAGSGNSGGLIGTLFYGSVTNCFSLGTVVSTYLAAGLIGYALQNEPVYITNCYSLSNVSGSFAACGLIGNSDSNTFVTNCYAAGPLYGPLNSTHGLGFNTSDVNCFWDTELSGWSTSLSGTGKTTAEMKDIATFTNLETVGLQSPCWDFVNNPYDDTSNEDIWNMDACTNNGYPYLTWQSVTPPATTPTNVILSILGNDVQLVWDDIGLSSYYIYRSADPYAEYWNNIGSSVSNSFTDTDAALETEYFYYVTACD